jgi:uncharacterized protein (DUF58 family)
MNVGRRGSLRVSRALGCSASGGALILLGLLFATAPLFVPGVAFVLLGGLAPGWVWLSGRAARVVRGMEQERVVEDEPLEATLKLRTGLLRPPAGEVFEPLAGQVVRLPRGRQATIRVLARFDRRGRLQLPPPSLVVRDPLELAQYVRGGRGPVQDVLVLPRTEPVRWARNGGERASSPASRVRADLLAAVEVDGLRPYRPGTPASRIHWAALARGAGLLERRLRVEGDLLPLVVLDARGTGPHEHLDAAVRAAASLTLELARTGGCKLLLPGSRRALAVESDLASWPVAHARLALVDGGGDARAPSPAALRAALGPLFYVTAQSLERLPAAVGRETRNASSAVIVLPAALSPGTDGRASFAVSGCHGFVVGARGRPAVGHGRSTAA